jgi:serine/threonine protein kinase
MTPEQWRRVGELFHQALDVPAGERTAWAREASSPDGAVRLELLSLLENDRVAANGFVADQVKSAVVSMFDTPTAAQQRAGPYRLLRELGTGGMGTVYLAERDDEQYQIKVAVKLVRAGMDTQVILHRFRRERQILAQLQHPNIARLLDGGSTEDGRPYIVMEYIDGVPITEYAKARVLSIPDRLALFLDICSAVEYAHQHFVVHRDLKPGNILVSATGEAKLLDFGICKLLLSEPRRDHTEPATLRMLTPEYASPEQVRGDPITTASDIYSLAAVLYQLLTGYKPHRIDKLTPQAVEQAICEQDVIRPSLVPDKALARKLSGDLDNILLKALQKDPGRRYASVEQFSDDLRRYLNHQPVKARPDKLTYRFRKFLRRRRNSLTAGGLIAACLIGGLVVSLREASIAKANLLEARRLANVFVFDVHDAVRDLPGSTHARRLIVETGLRYLDGLALNSRRDWNLKTELATAYLRIGDVQGNVMGANLGNTKEGLESYLKAMALLNSVLEHDPGNQQAQLVRITVLRRIGTVYVYTKESGRGIATFHEARKVGEALLAGDPGNKRIAGELAQVYNATGDALWVSGAFTASIEEDSKAVALLLKFSAATSNEGTLKHTLAAAYSAIGMDETRLGRLDTGLGHYRQALSLLEDLTRQDPANSSYQRTLMTAYSHLGDVLGNPKWRSLGDAEGALTAYQQMLAVARSLHETDPANQQATSDYAIALTRVAAVLPAGDAARRLSMLQESLQLLREIDRVNPQNALNRWDMTHGYWLLGDALIASDRPSALRAYHQSAALAEELVAAGVVSPAPDLVSVLQRLALQAVIDGDREAALRHARRALEICDPAAPAAKGRAENVQRFLNPRGSGAMGLTYSSLARTKISPPEVSAGDRRLAKDWLQKSLASWHDLQNDPAFAPSHREEMQHVEQAAAEMNRRW